MFGYILLTIGLISVIRQIYLFATGGAKAGGYVLNSVFLVVGLAMIYFGYRMEFSAPVPPPPMLGGRRYRW
jgi:hypothetical protein